MVKKPSKGSTIRLTFQASVSVVEKREQGGGQTTEHTPTISHGSNVNNSRDKRSLVGNLCASSALERVSSSRVVSSQRVSSRRRRLCVERRREMPVCGPPRERETLVCKQRERERRERQAHHHHTHVMARTKTAQNVLFPVGVGAVWFVCACNVCSSCVVPVLACTQHTSTQNDTAQTITPQSQHKTPETFVSCRSLRPPLFFALLCVPRE
jgi:hypothetical protein